MSKSIVIFVPQNSMSEAELKRAEEEYPDILFTSIDLSSLDLGQNGQTLSDSAWTQALRDYLEDIVTESIKVLVARGYNATCLRRMYPNLNTVELLVTSYDILRAIPPDFTGTAAVITSGLDILGLELIAQRCHINILDQTRTEFHLLERNVEAALAGKVDLIIGGSYTQLIANRLAGKMPVVLIPLGPEGLKRAVHEARIVVEAVREERAEQQYAASLMDMMNEGMVGVRGGRVQAVNAAAEKLLGSERAYLIGLPDGQLPPELVMDPDEESKIASFRGVTLLVRRASKRGDLGSYTLFLHEHGELSRMEQTVRMKMSGSTGGVRYTFNDISGMSPSLSRTIATAHDYAHSDANILILGESGCGKEVFAQSIHYESTRRDKPFIAVNCAGFTRELLQSELFGYAPGAFTGASRQGKAGIFELAHGGTVFLDEVAEMDFSLQASLLRVLQERYVVRVGSYAVIPVNVRLIAATNRNLYAEVRAGRFREDLYYRLNVLPLQVPPLRDRGQDAVQLMALFLKRFAAEGRRFTLTPEAQELILQYPWPGNVRELMNVAQRLAVTVTAPEIGGEALRGALQPQELACGPTPVSAVSPAISGIPATETATAVHLAKSDKRRTQMDEIRQAIAACDGNLSEAAKHLGISRITLWRRIKRFEKDGLSGREGQTGRKKE